MKDKKDKKKEKKKTKKTKKPLTTKTKNVKIRQQKKRGKKTMIENYRSRWARSDKERHETAQEAAKILIIKRRQSEAERRIREKAGNDPNRTWRL